MKYRPFYYCFAYAIVPSSTPVGSAARPQATSVVPGSEAGGRRLRGLSVWTASLGVLRSWGPLCDWLAAWATGRAFWAIGGASEPLAAPGGRRGPLQMGSLAGAAHLLKHNAGVLREAQSGRKPDVDYKGKSPLHSDFQYEYEARNSGLTILIVLFS